MPAGQYIYTIRGSGTTGAAAVKDYLSFSNVANQRCAIIGVTFGNQSATSAQGVAWQLVVAQTGPTASAFVPQPVDTGNARAALAVGSAVVTVNSSGTVTILEEFAFDIVGSYTKWYPPGKELWIDGTAFSSGTNYTVRKAVGADTSTWSITNYHAE
jgi:hypothetical protein